MSTTKRKANAADRFEEMQHISAEISERATAVSDGIERVQAYLETLPGRFEESVAINDNACLWYMRHKGAWRLVVIEGSNEIILTEAPLKIKTMAAPHINNLLAAIEVRLRSMLPDIDKALKCLDGLGLP